MSNKYKYIHNPKTENSGILGAIPQTGRCPNNCEDCFFQSGRSYLEPLDSNLPNMPSPEDCKGRIIRVNDGNDSNVNREVVIKSTAYMTDKFYNTAIPKNLDEFDAPVVLTLNPGKFTDKSFHKLAAIPKNLMFVRFRTNMWNLDLAQEAIDYYSALEVPIILTFMAYYDDVPTAQGYPHDYIYRQRTMNSYYAITTNSWIRVMDKYRLNKWVYSCGKIEGEKGVSGCRFCGNCLREYYATKERIRKR